MELYEDKMLKYKLHFEFTICYQYLYFIGRYLQLHLSIQFVPPVLLLALLQPPSPGGQPPLVSLLALVVLVAGTV